MAPFLPDTPGNLSSYAKEIRGNRAARPLVPAAPAPRGDALYMVGALRLSSAFFQFFSPAPPSLPGIASGTRMVASTNHSINQISTMRLHPDGSMFREHIGLDLPQRPAAIRMAGHPAEPEGRRRIGMHTDIWPFFAMIGTH